MAQTEQMEKEDTKTAAAAEKTEVKPAELTEAADTGPDGGGENLDLLLDINMPVTINLGRTQMPLRRLLGLSPGSVLPLDKPLNQPAELYVQDIKFATADIVVVDDCFGVRIRQIFGIDSQEKSGQTKQ